MASEPVRSEDADDDNTEAGVAEDTVGGNVTGEGDGTAEHGSSSPDPAAGLRTEPEHTPLGRWEARTEWPLIGLSVLFFGLYAWTVLEPYMAADLQWALDGVMWLMWAAFAVDYGVRLYLARDKFRFVLRNVLDLVVLLVPMLRQLRVLRLLMVLVLMNRRAQHLVRGRMLVYVGAATVLLGVSAALAELDSERGAPGATITNFGDALWWTMTTMTTVGYGDYSPVTPMGKVIAAGLMLAGIALLGVVTGSIASWFVEKFGGMEREMERAAESRADSVTALHGEVASLKSEMAALRAELAAAREGSPPHEPR